VSIEEREPNANEEQKTITKNMLMLFAKAG
jgi:hypothetical protein